MDYKVYCPKCTATYIIAKFTEHADSYDLTCPRCNLVLTAKLIETAEVSKTDKKHDGLKFSLHLILDKEDTMFFTDNKLLQINCMLCKKETSCINSKTTEFRCGDCGAKYEVELEIAN